MGFAARRGWRTPGHRNHSGPDRLRYWDFGAVAPYYLNSGPMLGMSPLLPNLRRPERAAANRKQTLRQYLAKQIVEVRSRHLQGDRRCLLVVLACQRQKEVFVTFHLSP